MSNIKIYPPIASIDDLRWQAIEKVDKIIEARLLGGFDFQPPAHSCLPEGVFSTEEPVPTFHFATQLSDQANFSDASTLFLYNAVLQNPNYIQYWRGWIGDNAYTLQFNLQTYPALGTAYADHKNGTLAQGWAWKQQLTVALSIDAMIDIFKSFNITQEEMNTVKCNMFTLTQV